LILIYDTVAYVSVIQYLLILLFFMFSGKIDVTDTVTNFT